VLQAKPRDLETCRILAPSGRCQAGDFSIKCPIGAHKAHVFSDCNWGRPLALHRSIHLLFEASL